MNRQTVLRALNRAIQAKDAAQAAADRVEFLEAYTALADGLVNVIADLTAVLLEQQELDESMDRHPAGSAVPA